MYQSRHAGPPPNPQPPPPSAQNQFSGPMSIINESCDRIKKEFDAIQAANHSLRMEVDKLHNEKAEVHKHFIMYYEMSYGLHLDVCKQKEIAKRLNNIILNILPFVSNDQQAQIASSVDRAKQVTPEELNSIVDAQMREGYGAPVDLNPSLAGLSGLGRPMPGTPGLPGLPGMPPHGPPMHLPHNLPPHSMPPHGPPPLHGLPPQGIVPPGLNMSSPPNAAGLLAMSGASGLPGLGPGGLLAGMPGGVLPPHMLSKQDNSQANRNNPHQTHLDNPLNNNNSNNNHSNNNTFNNNNNKPPRGSIDSERRAASSSSATSERDREGHSLSQSMDSKHHQSKKHRRSDDSSHSQQHHVMMNNSSSVSDDEKSEDLVVDGNDERTSSPNVGNQNGSTSPRENGSVEWNASKGIKKDRPLSRASSVTSGCGPSGRERASPKTSGSHKAKSSPSTVAGPMGDPMNALGPNMPPNPMMPGLPGYGRSMYPMGHLGPDGMPVPPLGPGGVKGPFGPIPEPYSIQLDSEGRPKIIPCSPRALADPEVPKKAREVYSLDHGEVVCAVALSNPTRNIYTGGKGFVKVWSLDNSESNNEVRAPKVLHTPVAELACLPSDAYVRSCKLLPDGKKLIVGGEVPPISVWDLGAGSPVKIGELKELATACYALAISPDSKTCITCFSDGTIGLYDVHNLQLIGKFQGHEDGASCIDISSDGNTLWTGGLDTTLKSWNLNAGKIVGEKDYVKKTKFNSQIFSLGYCPSGDYIAVGMENSIIEVMSTNNKPDKMQLKMHDSCVLALKFAASGKWFVSTGKDKLLNICGSPTINCPQIMKVSLSADNISISFSLSNDLKTNNLSHSIQYITHSSRKIHQFYLAILVAMINILLQVQERRKLQYMRCFTEKEAPRRK